jgi:4-diphosphocytidyl-2-C-methyl-D-erythritol kinase
MAERRAAHKSAPVLRSLAPAKLNLYLHVPGRRTDGYHLLDSLIAFAGVCDALEVEAAADLSLTIDGPRGQEVPVGDGNLVLKAAQRLRAAAGIKAGGALKLTKQLPVAAGIGGGSADAAAALRILARLWGLEAQSDLLQGIALELGADVPACLSGETTFAAGIGEILTAAPVLPPVWLVLANPGIALVTADVFTARSGGYSDPAPFAGQSIKDATALARTLSERRNDLTDAAIGLVPAIKDVLAALDALPGRLLARMSGSGATCFALFASQAEATAAAAGLAAAHPAWWVAPAPLLSAAPQIT